MQQVKTPSSKAKATNASMQGQAKNNTAGRLRKTSYNVTISAATKMSKNALLFTKIT